MNKATTFTTDTGAKCDYCGADIAKGKEVTTTGRYDYCNVDAIAFNIKKGN